jgi:hypothetical protein
MKPANPLEPHADSFVQRHPSLRDLEPHADSFVQLHPSLRDLVRVTVRRPGLTGSRGFERN